MIFRALVEERGSYYAFLIVVAMLGLGSTVFAIFRKRTVK